MTIRWYGLVAPEQAPTGDRRMFQAGSLGFRDFPLPALWQRVSGQGHSGSVVVASWDRQYAAEGGVWAAGEFLDPAVVPEVTEAIYLLEKRLIGPSVDLDPDLAYEVVDHPSLQGEYAMQVTRATVHGVTFVSGPAFPQVHITVDNDEEMAVLASAGITMAVLAEQFAVNGKTWRSMPVAPRETEFDADSAIQRIAEWSQGDPSAFARAFLYYDTDQPANNRESYRLPIADVHNGKLTMIPRAVFSAATILSGAHGGLPNVPDEQKIKLQQVVTEIYDTLREDYGDPRVMPPWQRGGRAGATSSDSLPTEASMEGESFAVNASGWSSMPIGSGSWDEGAARQALDEWAGDSISKYYRAFLWNDGSGNKTGAKFPIARPVDGTLTIIPAAVNNAKARLSQANISGGDKTRILGILNRIQERFGQNAIGEVVYHAGEVYEDDVCPEGSHMMPDGTCMDDDDDMPGYVTAGAGVLKPPAEWFADPKLKKATPLRVGEDGRVFGHLATWKKCHLGVGNKCVVAPKSKTGYRHFHLGSVLTEEGREISVGKITLGTGHADKAFGVVPAAEHYDNTGTCVAVVRAGEDRYGVWVSGALVAGIQEATVAELRRSPLSGDWRRVDGNLELVAALAVNDPGFPVVHNDGDDVYSLTAAGVFDYAEGGEVREFTPLDFPISDVFLSVDSYLSASDKKNRRDIVSQAFQDMLPDEDEGCGCDVRV